MFMFSLCSLLSEEPKPSKHQELISTLQEIALKKKKSYCGNMSYQDKFKNLRVSLLQLLLRYFGEM